MKLPVSPAKPTTVAAIAIAAVVVAAVLVATALSGPGVNVSSSAAALARADAARIGAARATAALSPDLARAPESALRAEIMRLRALGQLRGPVLPQLLDRLAAQGAGAITGGTGTGGTITGVVRGAHGMALRGVCVTATARTGLAGATSQAGTTGRLGQASTAFAMTGPDGRYALTGLRPGSYTLAYRDCAAPGRYFSQWSGAAAWPGLATPVSVTAGQVRATPPITLRPANPAALLTPRPRVRWITSASQAASTSAGRISGLVTGKGKPLRGICVIVWRLFGNGGAAGVGTRTSRTGTYSVGNLRRGRYQVQFAFGPPCGASNWLMQWYNGVNGFNPFPPAKATTIMLRTGQKVRGIDAKLTLGGQISGVVTDKSGNGLHGICVDVEGRLRNGFIGFGFQTDRTGHYALHGAFPGRYTVGFSTGCGNQANFAPQWWRDSPTVEHATQVHIVGSKIARNVDAKLLPGAAITGVVRAVKATGQPLRGVCVSAISRDGSIMANATTTSQGTYRLIGLGTGRYFVTFDPSCGGGTTSIYLGIGKVVSARAGTTKTGVNAFLPLGAGVSGTVTDSHGHPLSGICVEINGQQVTDETQTATNGTYSIEGVPAGSYLVQFSGGCGNSGSYAPQLYNDESNFFDADPVALTAGNITPSINATMRPGGTITGVVTDRAGHRLGEIFVAAISRSGSSAGGGFYAGFTSNGNFRIPNMAPGQYQIQFGSGKYASQSFRSTSNPLAADLVSVNAGTVTRGIDAALSLAGTISGVVTDQAGHPLSGICVIPVRLPAPAAADILVAFLPTGHHGTYHAAGLAPGTYAVLFVDCQSHLKYASQWYRGKASLAAATKVRVTAGGTTKGIGAAMAVGGSISGVVRMAGTSAALANVCVLAVDNATQMGGFAATNFTGHYTIPALATGTYHLSFAPCGNQNLVSITRPGAVHVTAPHATTGINVTLAGGGSVSGTVLGSSPTAKPQEGICVAVVSSGQDGSFVGGAITAANGTYTVTGLVAGSYKVVFGDPTCPFNTTFTPSWYNNEASQSTADPVAVTVGNTTSGIDATLLPGGLGAISGTVTGPSSAPVGGECVTAFNVTAALGPLFSGGSPEIVPTRANGSYTLGFLLPGTYKVRFDTGCGGSKFSTQWWDDAATRSAATTVTVSANATTTGINASLKP